MLHLQIFSSLRTKVTQKFTLSSVQGTSALSKVFKPKLCIIFSPKGPENLNQISFEKLSIVFSYIYADFITGYLDIRAERRDLRASNCSITTPPTSAIYKKLSIKTKYNKVLVIFEASLCA